MLKIKVNDKFNFEISSEKDQILLNGLPLQADMLRINARTYHVLYINR